MAALHLDQGTFAEKALAAPVAVVDFWAPWCGPCRMAGPVIDQLSDTYEGKALVGKVNVDDNPALAAQYGVMTIPTVIYLKDGSEVDRKVGIIPPEEYAKVLDSHL